MRMPRTRFRPMLPHSRALRVIALLTVLPCLLSACEGDDEGPRGAEGESCTRRADCEDGLRCIALVCVRDDAPQQGGDAGQPSGCGSRSDCGPGFGCVDGRCTPAAMGVSTDWRYGGRGETCSAANDCLDGLACISGTCRQVGVSLARTPRQCVRVECEAAEDCCESFVPDADCDIYRENCETDPIFCNTYRNLCECNQDCVDELCMTSAPGCSSAAECMSQQTPFCVDDRCVQCDVDSSCPGAGSRCIDGACLAPCEVDENCPLLHACQDGECVEVGCQSDRECVFLEGDPLSACRDGVCEVPCTRDSECAGDGAELRVCSEGRCEFVGCESDTECRALLGLESSAGDARAVCR